MRGVGHGVGRRFLGHENGPRLPRRQTDVDRFELERGVVGIGARGQELAGLAEREAVARQQPLQSDRLLSQPLGLGRRAPFPPLLHPVLIEEPLDDGGEVSGEGAAAFELPDDVVVLRDERELHLGSEVFGSGGVEAVRSADEADDPVDRPQVLQEDFLRVLYSPVRGVTQGCLSGVACRSNLLLNCGIDGVQSNRRCGLPFALQRGGGHDENH